MKKITRKNQLIIAAVVLFALSTYLAMLNGQLVWTERLQQGSLGALHSPIIYTGFKGGVAQGFAYLFNALMSLFGSSLLASVIALALLVELVLLYPSVKIQLKQKKIHLLHKKLIDRFRKGDIAASSTKKELHKLYTVNEQVHRKGAFYVSFQLALFFFTFWGLHLIVKSPNLMQNSWSALNFSLLSKSATPSLGILAATTYLLHAMIKMYYKQKEDYIDPTQSLIAFIFAIGAGIGIYLFSQYFAVAMVVYLVTLTTFSTIRFIVVEQHARQWNHYIKKELITDLRESEVHENRFQYLSRLWNHLPVVRHVNFGLLEEALSMTLGLLLVLTFLGAFGSVDGQVTTTQVQATLIQLEFADLLK